jgi:hypothetical protein
MALQKVKILASQAESIYAYKNIKTKLSQCCANIHFNKQCLSRNIIPSYAKIKVPYTSQAAAITQRKAQTLRVKDEIRFLYRKKEQLNRQLYYAHLQATHEWGPIWDVISHSIHENLNALMKQKYLSQNQKLQQLSVQTHVTQIMPPHHFHPQVVNLTDIAFTENESRLLQKGLNYNLHEKPNYWLKTLAIEAFHHKIRMLYDIWYIKMIKCTSIFKLQ